MTSDKKYAKSGSHNPAIISPAHTRFLVRICFVSIIISQSLHLLPRVRFVFLNLFHDKPQLYNINTLLNFSIQSYYVALIVSRSNNCIFCFQQPLLVHEFYYWTKCCLGGKLHSYLLAAHSMWFFYYHYLQLVRTRCLSRARLSLFFHCYLLNVVEFILYKPNSSY